MSHTAFDRVVLVSALLLGAATPVAARGGEPISRQEFALRAHRAEALAERVGRIRAHSVKLNKLRYGHGVRVVRRQPTVGVPELDPNAATSALLLLLGGAMILRDSRSSRVRTGRALAATH